MIKTKNYSEYCRLKHDPNYRNVVYNPNTDGLKATHIGHNFDKTRGYYEVAVQEVGYKSGHAVILEAERPKAVGQKSCDGTWDGLPMEIKASAGSSDCNIRESLKHGVDKKITRVMILFYNQGNFDAELFEKGYAAFTGLKFKSPNQYLMYDLILCVQGTKIVQIKKPSC